MLLRDLAASSLRRWYLLLAGLILTVAGGYLVLGAVTPTYTATASMVLIPPRDVVVTGHNPYLYLGGLDQAVGVLQVKLNSPEVAKPLESRYRDSQLEVAKDNTAAGPIIEISSTAGSPPDALGLLNDVMDAVPGDLTALQQKLSVPPSSRISVMVLSSDHKATPSHKRQIRFLVVIGAGGIGATVLAAGALDRLLVTRRLRRAVTVVGETDTKPDATTDGDYDLAHSRAAHVSVVSARTRSQSEPMPGADPHPQASKAASQA